MKNILLCAGTLAVLASAASATTLEDRYSSFFVLGDSLSDVGNLPVSPLVDPYFDAPGPFGRQFSNGPVFSDILDDGFNNGFAPGAITTRNYAFGGAQAVREVPAAPAPDVPDLPDQVAFFLADLGLPSLAPDLFPGTPAPGDRPLVSLWFGANDIFGALADVGAGVIGIPAAFGQATQAAQNVAAAVGTLAALPGFDDFVVLNLPDIGATPAFNTDPGVSGLASQLTTTFNATLAAELAGLALAEDVVTEVDIFSIFDTVVEDIEAGRAPYGLSIADTSCLTVNTNAFPYDILSECGPAVTDYVFWDGVHPTTAVHAQVARFVETAVVPLPAGLPLLAAGVIALGFLRRRAARG